MKIRKGEWGEKSWVAQLETVRRELYLAQKELRKRQKVGGEGRGLPPTPLVAQLDVAYTGDKQEPPRQAAQPPLAGAQLAGEQSVSTGSFSARHSFRMAAVQCATFLQDSGRRRCRGGGPQDGITAQQLKFF